MKDFQNVIYLILGNIIAGALLTATEPGIAKTILIVGLILVDIAAIYGMIRKKF